MRVDALLQAFEERKAAEIARDHMWSRVTGLIANPNYNDDKGSLEAALTAAVDAFEDRLKKIYVPKPMITDEAQKRKEQHPLFQGRFEQQ